MSKTQLHVALHWLGSAARIMATTTAPPSSASSGTHEDARPRTLACASAERPPSQARARGAHARPRADARTGARWTLKEALACDRPPSPAAASRRRSCATRARASLHHTHTSAQRAPEREAARSATRAQRSAAPFADCHEPPTQRLPATSAARRASEPAPHTHTHVRTCYRCSETRTRVSFPYLGFT